MPVGFFGGGRAAPEFFRDADRDRQAAVFVPGLPSQVNFAVGPPGPLEQAHAAIAAGASVNAAALAVSLAAAQSPLVSPVGESDP